MEMNHRPIDMKNKSINHKFKFASSTQKSTYKLFAARLCPREVPAIFDMCVANLVVKFQKHHFSSYILGPTIRPSVSRMKPFRPFDYNVLFEKHCIS